MKKLIGSLALTLVATAAFAQRNTAPSYYSAEFKVTDISPMCPRTVPSGATCMGLGSIVTVEAVLNCGDKMVFNDFTEAPTRFAVDVYAVSVVKRDPNADRMRCYAPTIVKKSFPIQAIGAINFINTNIEAN